MLETLLAWDHALFELINRTWSNPVFDAFFPVWTDLHKTAFFKYALVPLLLFWIYRAAKWRGLSFILFAAIAVAANDGICGKILKPFFERPRPPLAGLDVILRAPHYGGYSFPSNHSSNMFCLAAFVAFFFPSLRWPLFTIALLTAFSRVYCGVHFPSDIIAGAFIGMAIGWVCALLLRPVWAKASEFFFKRGWA